MVQGWLSKETTGLPVFVLRLVPAIVMVSPSLPLIGEMLETTGVKVES